MNDLLRCPVLVQDVKFHQLPAIGGGYLLGFQILLTSTGAPAEPRPLSIVPGEALAELQVALAALIGREGLEVVLREASKLVAPGGGPT